MALQINTTTLQDMACSAAYVVIERGSYRKDTGKVRCIAQVYRDVDSRDAGQPPIWNHGFTYTYNLTGGEMIEQAYNALKLETEMSGYIDV